MDLSRNGLAGPIPYAWQNGTGNAASIRNLRLHDNLFSGPLPPLALPALIAATLHNNLFTGAHPSQSSLRTGWALSQIHKGLGNL